MMSQQRTKPLIAGDIANDPLAPSEYVIRAIIDGLDQVAVEMERKWGIDRLRLLVSDFLRAKFDAQKGKLDAAIATNREVYIRAQAEGMKRAWAALDKAATDAGAKPLSPDVWECVLSSGEVISIVRTEAEANHICRECRVFTIDEIALVIDGLPDAVLEAKKVFPGAAVTGVRERKPIDWEKGDELPV